MRYAKTTQRSPTTISKTARASLVPCDLPAPEPATPAATMPASTATEQTDPSANASTERGPARPSRKIAGISAAGDRALTSASASRCSQVTGRRRARSGARLRQLLARVGALERVLELALGVERLQAGERRLELRRHLRQGGLDGLRRVDHALHARGLVDRVAQLLLVLAELIGELVGRLLRLLPGLRVRLAEPLQVVHERVGRGGDVVLRALQPLERGIRRQGRRGRLQ